MCLQQKLCVFRKLFLVECSKCMLKTLVDSLHLHFQAILQKQQQMTLLSNLHYPLTSSFSCLTSRFIFYLACIRQLFITIMGAILLICESEVLFSIHHPSSALSTFYSPQTTHNKNKLLAPFWLTL